MEKEVVMGKTQGSHVPGLGLNPRSALSGKFEKLFALPELQGLFPWNRVFLGWSEVAQAKSCFVAGSEEEHYC